MSFTKDFSDALIGLRLMIANGSVKRRENFRSINVNLNNIWDLVKESHLLLRCKMQHIATDTTTQVRVPVSNRMFSFVSECNIPKESDGTVSTMDLCSSVIEVYNYLKDQNSLDEERNPAETLSMKALMFEAYALISQATSLNADNVIISQDVDYDKFYLYMGYYGGTIMCDTLSNSNLHDIIFYESDYRRLYTFFRVFFAEYDIVRVNEFARTISWIFPQFFILSNYFYKDHLNRTKYVDKHIVFDTLLDALNKRNHVSEVTTRCILDFKDILDLQTTEEIFIRFTELLTSESIEDLSAIRQFTEYVSTDARGKARDKITEGAIYLAKGSSFEYFMSKTNIMWAIYDKTIKSSVDMIKNENFEHAIRGYYAIDLKNWSDYIDTNNDTINTLFENYMNVISNITISIRRRN